MYWNEDTFQWCGQEWYEDTSQRDGPTPEHWPQNPPRHRRHNNRGKFTGPLGFGRGRRQPEDQEPYNDNYRQNYPHNRHDNRGCHNQNFPRFQRADDGWDNHQRDQRDAYPRQDGRNNRNQRDSERNDHHEDDYQRPSDENLEKSDPKKIKESGQGNYSNKSNRHSTTKVDPPSIVKEIQGDLFSAPDEFSLAHSVCKDFRMGSGIAFRFKTEFKRVGELLRQNVQVGGCAYLQDKNRYIFYLVFKEVSYRMPKLEDLEKSLKAMKAMCLNFGVKKLAMPRIGGGLDPLDWSRVKALINETFQDTNMEIRVYDFNVVHNNDFEVDFDLRSLLSSVEEVALCPVCLEIVKPPVTLCVNGHGMCTACKATLTKCPTCRKPFCNTNPRLLNEILQKIPKVCKYYDEGCRNLATNDHEVYCKFRKVKCPFHNKTNSEYCNWEGPAFGWSSEHVYCNQFSHLEPCWIVIDDTGKFAIQKFKDIVPTKSIGLYVCGEFEHDFNSGDLIFYYQKLNGNFWMYIKYLPLKKPTEIIFVTISFGNSIDGEVMYKYKIKATTMITLEREVKVEENVYCMRIPVEELEKLLDKNGNLCVNYNITTEPL